MALVLYNTIKPSLEGATLCLSVNLYNHIAFLQALDAAMHSASQIELTILFCLKLFQQIALLFKIKMYSDMFLPLLYLTKNKNQTSQVLSQILYDRIISP